MNKDTKYYLKLLTDGRNLMAENSSPLEYLSCYIFEFVTYDGELDELFARKALDVCLAISSKKTFEYIEDPDNYQWFIIMCNMPFFSNKLSWGTSIRGAWWELYNDDTWDFHTTGLVDGHNQITDIKFTHKEWLCFIVAMELFVKGDN